MLLNGIIEDKQKFTDTIQSIDNNDNKEFIFCEICFLSYKNDNSDKRYWYLIEAIKENKLV